MAYHRRVVTGWQAHLCSTAVVHSSQGRGEGKLSVITKLWTDADRGGQFAVRVTEQVLMDRSELLAAVAVRTARAGAETAVDEPFLLSSYSGTQGPLPRAELMSDPGAKQQLRNVAL